MLDFTTLSDEDYLWLTLWGEARGEQDGAKLAVACVIRNRVHDPKCRWGRDYRTVCLAPKQFSCWNVNDPNYKRLIHQEFDESAASCKIIATGVYTELVKDVTDGCNHYCTRKLYETAPPSWAKGREPDKEFGSQVFFKL